MTEDNAPRYIRIDRTEIGRATSIIVADPKLTHRQMKKTAVELFDHATRDDKRKREDIA